MFSFFKSKKEYNILKLFKVVDLEAAKQFQAKRSINDILSFLKIQNNEYPDLFDLNYSKKVYNGFEKFKNKMNRINDNDIVFLNANYKSSKSGFSFTNDILNTHEKQMSYICITIALDKTFLESSSIFELITKINNYSKIDYGYGLILTDDFDFDTEKKIKKSLLSNSISITNEDLENEKQKIEVKNGYIKKVYPYNFINSLQLKSLNNDDNLVMDTVQFSKLDDDLFFLKFRI